MIEPYNLFDSIIDSISIIDSKGKIVYTNRTWEDSSICNGGDSAKNSIGVNYLETCNNVTGQEFENAKEAKEGIQKVLTREWPIFEMEYPCHSKDTQRWFIMRVNILHKDSDCILISHIDVTKRKHAEVNVENKNRQLNLINERLNTTLLRIVHDIQSPLSSIEGLVNLSKLNDEKQLLNPYFSMIETSIVNLNDYIQDTLKIASLDGGVEAINFQTLINNFLESIKYSVNSSAVEIKFNCEQTFDFYSEKGELISIVSNIVSNSLKYSDANKSVNYIHINCVVTEMDAIISIVDNGIGMTKEVVAKIFDFNFQNEKSTSLGAGVGLHLVKKSIALINGTITVHSSIGVGTEFRITLPNLKLN